jgi:hypothetical protein
MVKDRAMVTNVVLLRFSWIENIWSHARQVATFLFAMSTVAASFLSVPLISRVALAGLAVSCFWCFHVFRIEIFGMIP